MGRGAVSAQLGCPSAELTPFIGSGMGLLVSKLMMHMCLVGNSNDAKSAIQHAKQTSLKLSRDFSH